MKAKNRNNTNYTTCDCFVHFYIIFSLEYLSIRSVQTETVNEKKKVHIEQRFQYIFLISQSNTFKNSHTSLMTICTRDRQLSLRHWDSYQNCKGKVEIYCDELLTYFTKFDEYWIYVRYTHFNIFSIQELFKWLNLSFYHCFWWSILLPSSNIFFFIFS